METGKQRKPDKDNNESCGKDDLSNEDQKKIISHKEKKEKTSSRRLWQTVEDKAIIDLVGKHGAQKWTIISKKLEEDYNINGRSAKQCRERYCFINK